MLSAAIEQNYCAYSNLQIDPMLRKLREIPEFTMLLKAAKDCQQSNLSTPTTNGEVAGP